ncbi:MAG: proprotein convertase P-domain-containing protein [Planctomycetota bacterium]|jgi:hypothetical protein
MNATHVLKRIVAILLIAVTTPAGAAFASPAHIYSRSFDLPIPAPDDPGSELGKGWMADAIIEITDHLTIDDLDVCISLTHGAFFDLQIILQSPAGTNVALNLAGNFAFIVRGEDNRLTAVGGSAQFVFDDEAGLSIEQAAEPFTDSYRPAWILSSFDNEDAYGTWRLQIHDAFYADTGTLNSFELIITTPEPATAILLILGIALLRLQRPYSNLNKY